MNRMIPRPGAAPFSCPGVGTKVSKELCTSQIPPLQRPLARVPDPKGTGSAQLRLARQAKLDTELKPLCKQGRAGQGRWDCLHQCRANTKPAPQAEWLCQEDWRTPIPVLTEGPTFLDLSLNTCPGEVPTPIAQLDCTRLCETEDSSTGTSNSLTEKMAGVAHETNPVSAELGRGLPSLHYFH